MSSILLFGGTGHLGKKIAQELQKRQYKTTAVVRSNQRKKVIEKWVSDCIVADVTDTSALHGICNGYSTVISSLGKSVSLNDKSKYSFWDIDYRANAAILAEALRSGVQKFVYVSALDAERYPHLAYFRAHHDFAEKLKQSGIDYSIIKPPALFSAFIDVIDMARKGQLATLGKGDKRTNPIYEGDLAKVVVDTINHRHAEIAAGGKKIYTRKEINELIQRMVAPKKKVHSVPVSLARVMLPLVKWYNKNMYDKLAFYTAVLEHDVIAPRVGDMTLEDYIHQKAPV